MQTVLTDTQVRTMLHLQATMNSKVDPDWIAAAYPYLRAVVVEAAEAIEHHGWKWWKKQHCDMAQLQMEIVDIWHFILSEMLLRNQGDEVRTGKALHAQIAGLASTDRIQALTVVYDGQTIEFGKTGLLEKLELLIGLSTARRIELPVFSAIMHDCDMSWNDLYAQYVSKNVLNFFRQDHGYKEGTYQKLWEGKEDNEHLVEIMQVLPATTTEYPQRLYEALKLRYPLS
jgi:dimeric dUTPase (all-alpha-NTP-PPase superfamily)